MTVKRYGIHASNFLSRLIMNKISEILPTRIKRIFYIGSVVGILFSKEPDPVLLDRINEALNVAYGSSSLLFSAYISDRIWADLILEDVKFGNVRDMDSKERWQLSLMLAHRCPDWLQYGTEQLMSFDVYETITRSLLKKAA